MSSGAYSLADKKVFVAGHRGMVGSAIIRRLRSIACDIHTVGRDKVDLRRQAEVEQWMEANRPQAVFIPAATVGGIFANDSRPAEFIYDNLMIETNLIHAAYKVGVEKLLFLGSSCIYPRMAPQPMTEDALLTGPLEPTNQWYAVAKIAGIKLCQAYRKQYGCDFISAMPTNLYGIGDNFDLTSSHVLPALMAKAHAAKEANSPTVTIWGTGTPLREFLYVDDCADALVFLMQNYSGEEHVNVGSGVDLPIKELAQIICQIIGYKGAIVHDSSKPDGTPRKVMDVSKLARLGWTPKISLEDGIARVYDWYLKDYLPNAKR
jgi:GDP-L-fucose synthase